MSGPDRRAVLLGAAVAPAAGPYAFASPAPAGEQIPLWPAGPPGGDSPALTERWAERKPGRGGVDRAVTGVSRPRLFVFCSPRPRGLSLLLIPGGGYVRQAYDHEGAHVARLFAARGVDAYVLLHRLPQEGWAAGPLAPLQDAQRAVRLVRARSAGRPVGVLGFSAGGHVAGRLATSADERSYAPVDAADALSAAPDLLGLAYPVATMDARFAHSGSRRALLGEHPAADLVARESIEPRVTATTPPTFLLHAADDPSVPVENTLAVHAALRAARVHAELHVVERGGHGFGLTLPPDAPGALWPELFLRWAFQPPAPETEPKP